MKRQNNSRFSGSIKLHLTYILLSIFFIAPVYSTKYYVDNTNGNDNNNGLSPSAAWQTLTKVNSFPFVSNDSVLFKRNGVWRGQFIPQSSGSASGYITFADYGTGSKPLLLGSVNISLVSDWISEGGNIWRSAQSSSVDIGNIIFNGANSFGIKKWNQANLSTQGDFWWDKNGTQVGKIYSIGNPGSVYSDIEIALGNHMVYIQQKSYLIFKNIALKYGSRNGFEIRNSHHIIIRDCDLSYIGGSELDPQVRYGNAIQFWANSNNNIIERCKIWEIYDTGLSNQNNASGGIAQQYNIFYRNNLVWNCGLSSFEAWVNAFGNSSTMKSIYFENNTCVNAGAGWGWLQRPDGFLQSAAGSHVILGNNSAVTDSIFIRNNIFYKGKCILFVNNTSVQTLLYTNMDYNCWYTDNTSDTIVALWTSASALIWTKSQFGNYQANYNKDANSLMADPQFVNTNTLDFRLKANSPCIDAGINTGITADFDLTSVPQNLFFDIGAFEHLTSVGINENNHKKTEIKVYPNPSKTFIIIQIDNNNYEDKIQVFNSIGILAKEVELDQKMQIDISGLANGIYFINFKKLNKTIKFIKD